MCCLRDKMCSQKFFEKHKKTQFRKAKQLDGIFAKAYNETVIIG